MKNLHAIAIVCGALVSCPTWAVEMLGFELASDFTTPQCATDSARRAPLYLAADRQPVLPCWQHGPSTKQPGQPADPGFFGPVIELPPNQAPFGVMAVVAIVVDGRLEGLSLSTLGESVQQPLLQALKVKFGEPSEASETPLQNAFGAQYVSRNAMWKKDGYTVAFRGFTLARNSGHIMISTNAADAALAARRAAWEASQPKF